MRIPDDSWQLTVGSRESGVGNSDCSLLYQLPAVLCQLFSIGTYCSESERFQRYQTPYFCQKSNLMEEAKQPEQSANSENAYQFDVSERGDKVTIRAKKSLDPKQAEEDYYSLLKTLLNINNIELEILKYANSSERVGRFIDIDPASLKDKLPLKSTSKINEAIESLHQKGILLKTKYSGLYDLVSPIAEYKKGKSIQLEISLNVDEA